MAGTFWRLRALGTIRVRFPAIDKEADSTIIRHNFHNRGILISASAKHKNAATFCICNCERPSPTARIALPHLFRNPGNLQDFGGELTTKMRQYMEPTYDL